MKKDVGTIDYLQKTHSIIRILTTFAVIIHDKTLKRKKYTPFYR